MREKSFRSTNSCRVVWDIPLSSNTIVKRGCLPQAGPSIMKATVESDLLDLDLGAALFELLLHGLAFFLRDTGFHWFRCAFDQVFCLLQTETGKLADDLNDLDFLVRGSRHEHYVERGLLFGCCCWPRTCRGRCGGSDRCGCRNAESGL